MAGLAESVQEPNRGKKRKRATKARSLIPAERIERSILLIRGHKVMLDEDLAKLYGITTGNLNEAVSRNKDRFPEDFAFRLTKDESAT